MKGEISMVIVVLAVLALILYSGGKLETVAPGCTNLGSKTIDGASAYLCDASYCKIHYLRVNTLQDSVPQWHMNIKTANWGTPRQSYCFECSGTFCSNSISEEYEKGQKFEVTSASIYSGACGSDNSGVGVMVLRTIQSVLVSRYDCVSPTTTNPGFACDRYFKCEGNVKWSCTDRYGWTDLGSCPSGQTCTVAGSGIGCEGVARCPDGSTVGATRSCTSANGMAGIEVCVGSTAGAYWAGCQALPETCGNGKCGYCETYVSCPQDCPAPGQCAKEGSTCGVGYSYNCCEGLRCDGSAVISGVCVKDYVHCSVNSDCNDNDGNTQDVCKSVVGLGKICENIPKCIAEGETGSNIPCCAGLSRNAIGYCEKSGFPYELAGLVVAIVLIAVGLKVFGK